jgi:hypothetical protein
MVSSDWKGADSVVLQWIGDVVAYVGVTALLVAMQSNLQAFDWSF